MARSALAVVLAMLAAGTVAGFDQALDRASIDAAIAIGRSRMDASRARFHQPYRIPMSQSPIDYVDVVTPFRRLVLLAEERAGAGDRLFGQRDAIAALGERATLVEILVEMTFHPLNVFVGVPEYGVELVPAPVPTTPVARIAPAHISRTPRFGMRVEGVPTPAPYPGIPTGPGASQPLVGGTLAASFAVGALRPNGMYDLVVSEKGKELARGRVSLANLR